ncbi:GntP family permease [Lacrimispora sp. 210928-DFI.3.58]|uniref:GntP family permease n=1 Tax=Lacrimispora sp. 210928-DFI.3.58 TaxID=2883214 RepID=UPI0015B778F4|nr:GntP family permease [Lacrimispora sp. 210928-DFI.3.58]MCB7321066.1 hypothetical protein [Lacrimispora sp. 210928-DFI.3.58]
MGIFLILLSIALVIVLVFRGVPVFYSAVIASLFCLLTAALFTGAGTDAGIVNYVINGMTSMDSSYVKGLGNYFTTNFCIFVLGAIFGKLFDNSGAADAIAEAIVSRMGAKAVIPAILLVGWVLTYGGVSVFVAFFAMYPLMLSLFKEADIPRRLLPLFYFAGAGTSSGWFPGSPQAHNLLPSTALGVSPSSWLVPGIFFAIIEMIIVVGFVFFYTNRCKKNGEHYELTEADKKIIAEKEAKDASRRPSWLVAALPMVVLIIVLNVVKLPVPVSLLVGILAAIICFFKSFDLSKFWGMMSEGAMGGVSSLFNTAAIVGFGSVVQAVPAYAPLCGLLVGAVSNPIVASVITVGGLAGVTGSGTGGIGLAMPVVIENFIGDLAVNANHVNLAALARCTSIAALTLDSLPHCGLVVSVISYTGNDHKSSYLPCAVVFCLAPVITVALMLLFIVVTGQTYLM